MPTLRYLAAIIVALEGVFVVVMGSVLLRRLPPDRIKGATHAELWFTFAIAGVIYGMAAYQIFRGRPRTMAWITACFSALLLPGVFRVVGVIPLLCLLAGIMEPWWRRRTRTKTGEGSEEAPPSGQQAATGAPAQTAGEGGSAILETLVTIAALFLQGVAWKAAPAWLQPIMPADAGRWGWITFGLAITAVTFFHELGHAVGGWMVRFRMSRFIVYPFDYCRTSKHSYFRLSFKTPLSGAYMGFPEHVRNLEARYLWMVACGPLGGMVFSFVCWMILWVAEGSITGAAAGVLFTSMSFGLVTNLLNLLPFKSKGMRLDGRVLWDAWFDRKATTATIAMLGCASSMQSSLRPREWPEDWVEQLRQHRSQILAAALLGASAEDRLSGSPNDHQAREDVDLTAQSLGQLVDLLKDQPKARAGLELHRAWLRSRYHGEKVSADFTAAASDKEVEPFEIMRLQAALSAAHGDPAGAVTLLHQAEASLSQTSKSGIDAADLDGLRAFRQELLAGAP